MAKLTIPAGFEQAFRFAVAIEVESDAEWIHQMSGALKTRAQESVDLDGPEPAKPLLARDIEEVLGAGAYLPKAIAIAVQAFEDAEGEQTIDGDPDVLGHVLEGLARTVVPAIMGAIPGPADSPDIVARIKEAAELLEWSAREAGRLYDEKAKDGEASA